MRTMLAITLLLLGNAAMADSGKKKYVVPDATSETERADQRERLTNAIRAREVELKPLYEQRRAEVVAVKNDKKKSEIEKRAAIMSLRKKYEDKMGALRVRIVTEERAKLRKNKGK